MFLTNKEYQFQKEALENDLENFKEKLPAQKLRSLMAIYLEALKYFVDHDLEEEFEELRARCKDLMGRDYVKGLMDQMPNDHCLKQVKRFVENKRSSQNLDEGPRRSAAGAEAAEFQGQ